MAIFVVLRTDTDSTRVQLGNKPTTIGRSSKADIKINDSKVSSVHCQIYIKEQKVIFEDLGSTNGSFVNEYKTEKTYIYIDDQVRIGRTTLMIDPRQMSRGEVTSNTRLDKTEANTRSVIMRTQRPQKERTKVEVDKLQKETLDSECESSSFNVEEQPRKKPEINVAEEEKTTTKIFGKLKKLFKK